MRETAKKLYKKLNDDNDLEFLLLARASYQEAGGERKRTISKTWLDGILDAYDPVTLYVYRHEAERKQERFVEGVTAAKKAEEITKAARYWAQMTAQYADTVTDKAYITAYKEAGVKYVRWHTAADERVCVDCRKRNGKRYPIDKIPPKPHWRCRCWLTPD